MPLPSVVYQPHRPSGKEREQQQRCYTTQDKPHLGQKRHLPVGMNQREERRHNNCRNYIAQQRKRRQVLYAAAQLAGNNRCRSGGRHNKTNHQSLTDYSRIFIPYTTVSAQCHTAVIRTSRQCHLCDQNNPMPGMQSQIQGVDLAEREEQHQPNHRWQDGCKMPEQREACCTNHHRKHQSILIHKLTDCHIHHYQTADRSRELYHPLSQTPHLAYLRGAG